MSMTAQITQISKIPHHQPQTASAPALSSSVSQETQLSNIRRPKPVRTVFHDLPTAHSLITSGTARSRQRLPSSTILDDYEEEDSIPLQDFEASKGKNGTPLSFLKELPLLPPLAATVQHRLNKHSAASDFCLAAEDETYASQQQSKKGTDRWKQQQVGPLGSSGHHIDLGASSSSLPLSNRMNNASLNNDFRSIKQVYDSYYAATPYQDLPSTPAPGKRSSLIPSQSKHMARTLSSTSLSLPEGSTVGNIYKHYVRSDIFDDIESCGGDTDSEHDLADGHPPAQNDGERAIGSGASSDSVSGHQLQQSALDLRTQRRAERLTYGGQPPNSPLPSLPRPSARLLPSSFQGIGPSSSYGDTQNLLDLSERDLKPSNASNGKGDICPDQARSESDTFAHLSPANVPDGRNHCPQIHVSHAGVKDYGFENNRSDDRDRQPLEREISKALRRASNFSTYSDGSLATSMVENYRRFHSKVSSSDGRIIDRRYIEANPCAEADLEEARAVAAQAQAFYDREAIPAVWTSNKQQNMVRVPIQRRDNFSGSPPTSPEDGIYSQHVASELGADLGDWETVGESGMGSAPKLGEGMAHRTGSSIADTSDDGTATTDIPEISDYGSTDRIAQHPGNIQYSGDYRQRDLKKIRIPVFLPVYGEHKVNGYLADSNRLRVPASPFNHTSRPLEREHRNPFNSPPPELMAKPSGSKTYSPRPHGTPKPNYFPAEASIETDSSDENAMATARPKRPGVVENFSRPFHWADGFKDPGTDPDLIDELGKFLKPIPHIAEPEDSPSSWQHIMAFAHRDPIEGDSTDGSWINEYPLGRGVSREHSFGGHALAAVTADRFVEQKTYGGNVDPDYKERFTLVNGPPGAFYQGISKAVRTQSKSEQRRRCKPSYHRSSATEPDGLRTLSLVASQDPPVTPSMKDLMDIGLNPSLPSRPNDFVYRSPLAPPKRKTWQQLYTKKQMSNFRETARARGISAISEQNARASDTGLFDIGKSTTHGLSNRHLGEEPRLWGGQQRQRVGGRFYQSPTRNQLDQPKRKKRFSIIGLCICNLVFPSLLLYSSGRLDWLMLWVTTGEFYSFGRPQKRIALFCFVGWCVAVFFGLIGFLIWWFTIR